MAVLVNYTEPMDLDYLEANLPTVEGMPSGVYNKERAVKLDWEDIARYQNLTEEFIERHIDELPLYIVLMHQRVSKDFVMKHKDKFPMSSIDTIFEFTDDEILDLEDRIVNDFPIHYFRLSQKTHSQEFIEDFMSRHMDVLFDRHFYAHHFSEEFIEKYFNYQRDSLKELTLNEFIDKQNDIKAAARYNNICIAIASYQPTMREDFLEKWANTLSWNVVSSYAHMDTDFIERHAEEIDWGRLYDNDNVVLDEEFIQKHIDRFRSLRNWNDM